MSDVEAIAETKIVSSVQNWFVSYQTSDPMMGLFQDSIISAYEMTHSKVSNIKKFHAMKMCNRTLSKKELKFEKQEYHSREILSKFLPEINYEGKAKFYVPDFAPYIKYKEDEINITIKRGVLERGVLDKATIGEGATGGIFHNIYIEKGPYAAIETLYNWQQIFNSFIYYHGITFGFKDIYMTNEARAKLNKEITKIINASLEVTKQLDEGQLVPPIEMSLQEYYEEMQGVALEHGDEFIKPIMEEIDPEDNWLYKFIFSGSKGDRSNMIAIYASIGSIGLKGGRIPQMLNGRTSINFQRYSTDPIARGYCPDSFATGINPLTFPFSAFEARYELIEVALGTAVAGAMNRNAVKNLESIIVGNTRSSMKGERIVQLQFGDTGVDPRKVDKVSFGFVKLSDDEFSKTYKTQVKDLDKKYHNKQLEQLLIDEFNQLKKDRDSYRHIMITLESHNRKNFLMKDSVRLPINPQREVNNVIELSKVSKYTSVELDIVKAHKMIIDFTAEIPYLCMNEIQKRKKVPIPEHLNKSTTLWVIIIRNVLCLKNLLRWEFDTLMLNQVFDRIKIKITNCFIEYGTNVGIIAAESISEPITQFLLDSKHLAGIKKEKTNMIVRFDEILKNKPTEELDNPQMILTPWEEYQNDRQKVLLIANHIEMLELKRFVTSTKIFIEDFGKPVHPQFSNESTLVNKFQSFNLGVPLPNDLINWCIRFELSQEEMILKSMKIKTIYLKLKEQFPQLYIVYTLGENPLLRVYIRNSMFKRGVELSQIIQLSNNLKNCVIRGYENIHSARVISVPKTLVKDDGSLEVAKVWLIETDGTNMSKILENPYINAYESWTTSIDETEHMYGIEAARNKIVEELLSTEKHKANYEWATIYADEMVYNGRVTSIQRSGLGQRELNNVLLRASFGSPIQVLQQAAINNQTDKISGMSAPLVLGTAPRFGTTYNDIMIDPEAIEEEDFTAKIDAI